MPYSDAAIARFKSLDPNWEPPVEMEKFRFECDEKKFCRCFCTECNNLVFNIIYNCDWAFKKEHGLPHVPHTTEATCINNACMMSIPKETHELTSTHVDKKKKLFKGKKYKKVSQQKLSFANFVGRSSQAGPSNDKITYKGLIQKLMFSILIQYFKVYIFRVYKKWQNLKIVSILFLFQLPTAVILLLVLVILKR